MDVLYERQLALHEAFRRLGFEPEEIFVAFNRGNPAVVVRADGKEFTALLGVPAPATQTQYMREWEAAVTAWNSTMTEAERQRIFTEHVIDVGVAVPLLMGLQAKGFRLKVAELGGPSGKEAN